MRSHLVLLGLAGCAVLAWSALTALPVRAQPSPAYEALTISALRARSYGEGSLRVERTLQVTAAFTRTLIQFDSDGLRVYGFMNIPRGKGPFPTVIVLHGYVNPRTYRTPYAYTQPYADALARAGFLVVHPDYRGHGRSEGTAEGEDNLFRVGYAVDVLNLIAHLRKLPQVDANAIGLFGHSMGGGIAQRVISVDRGVKAVVLYGSMSGDERLNVERIRNVFRRVPRLPEDDVPGAFWSRISPISYAAEWQAAVELHHGVRDAQVPIAWSRDLHRLLTELGKPSALFEYPEGGHVLQGRDRDEMMRRAIAFFRRTLAAPAP